MVLLSGASWSKFATGAKFINLVTGCSRAFYHQLLYKEAMNSFFEKHLTNVHKKLASKPLSLAVDVRYDSPGFSANKATSVFMDCESRLIVHLDVADSREVQRYSPKMEKLLVERGLEKVIYHYPLVIWEIVSDASRTIIALLKSDRFKHIRHSLDIWHKAKKLAYMLGDAAKKAAHRSLLPWIRPTVNHFWYCCSSCGGDAQKLVKKWFKILHHVTNEHEWSGGRCNHAKDTNTSMEKWLSKNSSTYTEFRKIVVNKEFTGNFNYYTTCRQTWAIENFYSHTLLHYCPKQVSFGFDSYVIRNQLAVIDYNHHLDREIQQAKDGTSVPVVQFSRKTKQWVAYDRRVAKCYTYIPDLIASCLRQTYGARREAYTKSLQAKTLDQIATNLSGETTPSSKELLNSRKKRKTCGLALSSSI
ncbi:uncharacterized protein LOC133196180 [Saccostrea echinata]|uniref:uncharacterized protein LOC133196180 n=1 Tax=Saccostrea echinata TaxID=191078 RepID=UPI002A827A8F|nr:uncharacterized protein LOC133196180 [Saccostrea echinata]